MKALILIDLQNDFIPGGSLSVPEGDKAVQIANQVQPYFDLVIASQDWHPLSHVSFASNHEGKKEFEEIDLNGMPQTLWPDHCVQNSEGAEFHPDLKTNQIEAVFRKGTDPKIDSYSAFYDNAHLKSTGLAGYLKEKEVKTLYFLGLAGDICVYFSIKDALELGFECVMIEDGALPLNKETFTEQKKELLGKGVRYMRSEEINL